jgi:uncharacterized membrane protein (DUF4010 family)
MSADLEMALRTLVLVTIHDSFSIVVPLMLHPRHLIVAHRTTTAQGWDAAFAIALNNMPPRFPLRVQTVYCFAIWCASLRLYSKVAQKGWCPKVAFEIAHTTRT